MGWNSIDEQCFDGEELYQKEIQYTWGIKFEILKHKVVGKKKGYVLELVKNKETDKISAHRTIFEIDKNGSAYKHVDLGYTVPKDYIDGMTLEYQEMYKKELKAHKDRQKEEKEKRKALKTLKAGQLVEINNGQIVEFISGYSAQRFVGVRHNSTDKEKYGWHYKNVRRVLEAEEIEKLEETTI